MKKQINNLNLQIIRCLKDITFSIVLVYELKIDLEIEMQTWK